MEGQRAIHIDEEPHKAQSRTGKFEPCKELKPEPEPIVTIAMELSVYLQFLKFLIFHA